MLTIEDIIFEQNKQKITQLLEQISSGKLSPDEITKAANQISQLVIAPDDKNTPIYNAESDATNTE